MKMDIVCVFERKTSVKQYILPLCTHFHRTAMNQERWLEVMLAVGVSHADSQTWTERDRPCATWGRKTSSSSEHLFQVCAYEKEKKKMWWRKRKRALTLKEQDGEHNAHSEASCCTEEEEKTKVWVIRANCTFKWFHSCTEVMRSHLIQCEKKKKKKTKKNKKRLAWM